jgi:hypothetical protein
VGNFEHILEAKQRLFARVGSTIGANLRMRLNAVDGGQLRPREVFDV